MTTYQPADAYEPEEIYVDDKSVACDGGGGALGHPRVWLAMDSSGRIECPYCSRIFVQRPGAPSGEEIRKAGPPGVKAGDPTITTDPEPQGG